MTAPASETAIADPRSSDTAKKRSPSHPSPPGAPARRAPDATHEIEPLVGPRVADAEDRAEDPVLQQRDVQRADGIPAIDGLLVQLEPMPGTSQIDAERSRPAAGSDVRWPTAGRPSRSAVKHLRRRLSPQITNYPIVGKYVSWPAGNSTARNQLYSSSPRWRGWQPVAPVPPARHSRERWCPSAT